MALCYRYAYSIFLKNIWVVSFCSGSCKTELKTQNPGEAVAVIQQQGQCSPMAHGEDTLKTGQGSRADKVFSRKQGVLIVRREKILKCSHRASAHNVQTLTKQLGNRGQTYRDNWVYKLTWRTISFYSKCTMFVILLRKRQYWYLAFNTENTEGCIHKLSNI